MIQELESLVREGRLDEARKRLAQLNHKKIQRPEALACANLARRLDLGRLSLRILNPIVRPEGRRRGSAAPATAEEKIEYAASLRISGAVGEAAGILAEIDPRRHPQAALQLAFCHITEWRYREAIPLLESYVRSFKAPAYAVSVAKINLLEAWIHEENLQESRKLIRQILGEIGDPGKSSLLYLKCQELAAQAELLLNGKPDQAIAHLENALRLLDQGQDSLHALLLQKWLAISRSLKSGRVIPELTRAREQALRFQNWETVRDCDFYISRIARDRDALIRLYFGTPYESFRRKILEALGGADARLPESFLWSGERATAARRVFDLAQARVPGEPGGSSGLTPGQALHRLLILLCQDHYKPLPLISIFSKIFPDEYFNPDSSPNRVHQLIKRFRQWTEDGSLPLELEELSGTYRLRFTGPLSISIPLAPLALDSKELALVRLRSCLGHGPFTAAQAERATDSSRSALKLLFRWALAAGKLKREGRTHRTLYKFVP